MLFPSVSSFQPPSISPPTFHSTALWHIAHALAQPRIVFCLDTPDSPILGLETTIVVRNIPSQQVVYRDIPCCVTANNQEASTTEPPW